LMHVGLCTFVTEYSADPVTLGRQAEERGFESLFFPEHTHIPASRETPYPGGGELPREYSHMLDPFVALAAAAGVTERIQLDTGIVLVIERDPIVTAKEVATLDVVSGGRVLFGVGAGWNLEEMRNHGTDPERRFGVMRERVEAMKAIWTEDEAEYHGDHVDFDPIWQWPKPVQKPHPPVLVGGMGDRALDRVVALGDEWMPNVVVTPEVLGERIEDLQRRAAAAGRGRIPVRLFAAKPEARAAERLRGVGVDAVLFYLPTEDAGETERRLDRLTEVAAEIRGG
ncbi:MAG: LLM class F420-dependent oxidoreductase, partial [Thermoleophilaceae bacterium]|nr:LLM class F420-dependent oxidoreductase [Thermoleophilaceae bacterium]